MWEKRKTFLALLFNAVQMKQWRGGQAPRMDANSVVVCESRLCFPAGGSFMLNEM